MNRNSVLFFPVTFCLSGENLSLSQDAMSSVPNGAVRGFTWALAWLSGDVALLPLKSQNQRYERADEQEAGPNARVCPYCCVFNPEWLPTPERLERSDISDTNPFFQRAYLLESSPPKKSECGAYGLVAFSSTSSWLNNPEGRRQFSDVNSTVLDDWTTGVYSLMKTKSESVCVLWNADSKHQYISGGCCLQSCFYLPVFWGLQL